ncbi:hypothetical protein GCM10009668_11950 [Nocardioides dubius]|uniref:Uncharacterized protein n=1 Tax=Nocardioides dubius TaxID=317019 RepID=A0ABN1TQZ8_9ACTN
MDAVVLGESGRTLTFSDPQARDASPSDFLTVAVVGPDLRASRQVYAGWENGFSTLAAFFADLADHWRGWSGQRVFESIEGDLRILATHDGHVNLQVRLWETTEPHGWRVESEIRVDAGEALSRAANEVAALITRPQS